MSKCENCKHFYYQGMCKKNDSDYDLEKMAEKCNDFLLNVKTVIRYGTTELCPYCTKRLDHLYTGMKLAYCKYCGGKFWR